MSSNANALTSGSCLCSAVKYSYSGSPLGVVTELCHCLSCQKWTGGAFTPNVTVETQRLAIVRGNDNIKRYWTKGGSGKRMALVFCGDCGSGLWNEPEATPNWICIKSGTIDDDYVRHLGTQANEEKEKRAVDIEFFVKDRVQYLKAYEGAKQEERM